MKCLSKLIVLGLVLAGCTTGDREAEEALNSVILISRSQEAFYVEHGKFTNAMSDLKVEWLNLKERTPNYTYELSLFQEKDSRGVVVMGLNNKKEKFVALVNKSPDQSQFNKIFCRGRTNPPLVFTSTNCPPGFTVVSEQKTES